MSNAVAEAIGTNNSSHVPARRRVLEAVAKAAAATTAAPTDFKDSSDEDPSLGVGPLAELLFTFRPGIDRLSTV